MSSYIYTVSNLGKVIPPKKMILNNINLSFYYGAKIGILGLNGAGKSTLLKILAGVDKDIVGEAIPKNDIKICYLAQEPKLDNSKNVKENVLEGIAETKALLDRFNVISEKFTEEITEEEMNELLAEQSELQNKIDAANAWDLDRTLEIASDALRLPSWESNVENLSGGEKRRVALCKLLLSTPDLLLLDEPTNHLDAESVAWLERYLKEFKGTVIAITHDRYFLDNVAGWILELDRGEGIPFEGNYSAWLAQKEKRIKLEEKQAEKRKNSIKAELEWVRSSPKGRHAKNKARLNRFEELSSKEFQKRNETLELYIPPGERLGEHVLELKNVTKSFKGKILFENLNIKIPRGSIVGIIGPNGAGKTTFFKLINGTEKPDSGVINIGDTVQLSYVDQSRDALNDNKTVWQEISDELDVIKVGNFEMPSRAYVGRFNLKGHDQQKYIKDLSGGERNRVHLAKLLKKGGNFLLLDEPTNDLDVETLRALEEALLNFPGCIMVISHDRWFLDRIATHILSFEGENSNYVFYEGTYSDYEQDRKRRLGDKANQPHRIVYKKLQTVD